MPTTLHKDIIDKVETFDEVFERFAPAAKTPITLYGETYAVPETMSFPMMFYRKDIFVETNLEVPNTWDQFVDCIAKLQAKSLNVGFPSGLSGTMLLMYQAGETLYDEGNYDQYLINIPNFSAMMKPPANTQRTYEQTYGRRRQQDYQNCAHDRRYDHKPRLQHSSCLLQKVCQYFTMYGLPVSYAWLTVSVTVPCLAMPIMLPPITPL